MRMIIDSKSIYHSYSHNALLVPQVNSSAFSYWLASLSLSPPPEYCQSSKPSSSYSSSLYKVSWLKAKQQTVIKMSSSSAVLDHITVYVFDFNGSRWSFRSSQFNFKQEQREIIQSEGLMAMQVAPSDLLHVLDRWIHTLIKGHQRKQHCCCWVLTEEDHPNLLLKSSSSSGFSVIFL